MSREAPMHPGDLIRELIEEANWTIGHAADELRTSRQQLTRLLSYKSGVSPEMAIKLEAVFGSTAEMWMRLQHRWELAQVRQNEPDLVKGMRTALPA